MSHKYKKEVAMNYNYKQHQKSIRREWWINFIGFLILICAVCSGLVYSAYKLDTHINKYCQGRLINCFDGK